MFANKISVLRQRVFFIACEDFLDSACDPQLR